MKNSVLVKMTEYFGQDIKRINHALKVYGFAGAIAEGENMEPRMTAVLAAAAALHDIGIHEAEKKHGSTAGCYQELEGPPIARSILEELGADKEFTDRVCFLVGSHHSYSKIDGLDFQALIEADLIVNIDEGDIRRESAASLRDKYFRTKTGTRLITQLYL